MNKSTLLTTLFLICATFTHSAFSAPPKGKGKRGPQTVSVYSELVDYHEISQRISLIGKLQSDQFVDIATEVSGKVIGINVQANQQVEEGQLLFTLDATKAQAQLLEAKAYLADQQRQLNEHQRLIKTNTVTQSALDAQISLVDIAKARLISTQSDVNDHFLKAPFSGTIGLIDFSRGQMVSVGSELMTLDDLSTMELDLQVPERYLSLLSEGMQVQATNRAWPEAAFIGELTAIDSRVNEDTLNLRIRVQFDNKDNRLKPGMMMSAQIVFPAVNAPIIPVQAIEYAGTKRFVYRITDKNKVQRTEVVLGGRIDDSVLIESGIEVGARIVVQGLVNMSDGVKINDLSQPQPEKNKQLAKAVEEAQ